jgi:hypothetical protein
VAGVGVAVGVALIVVGVKRRKAQPSASASVLEPDWLMGGWVDREGGGLALQGRF